VAGFIPAWCFVHDHYKLLFAQSLENGVNRRLGGDKPRHYIFMNFFDLSLN
jgi:hypothetical protein